MPLILPPPPKNRGIVGLLVALLFVGWTCYIMINDAGKIPATKLSSLLSKPAETPTSGPTFVEIDLRGPEYEKGRYAGYQKGLEAKSAGFTAPAENVLTFNAEEAARAQALDKDAADDFAAGHKSGYTEAMKSENKPLTPQR